MGRGGLFNKLFNSHRLGSKKLLESGSIPAHQEYVEVFSTSTHLKELTRNEKPLITVHSQNDSPHRLKLTISEHKQRLLVHEEVYDQNDNLHRGFVYYKGNNPEKAQEIARQVLNTRKDVGYTIPASAVS